MSRWPTISGRIRTGQSRRTGRLGPARGRGDPRACALDGARFPSPRVGIDHHDERRPGHWRQDPIEPDPDSRSARTGASARPFVLARASQFRGSAAARMTSAEYAAAFDEVSGPRRRRRRRRRPSARRSRRSSAYFWAYDGTPSLVRAAAALQPDRDPDRATSGGTKVRELARLLALVNVAMADAGIAIWESKYFYDFWRPVTGIREADPETGPTGAGDGNPETVGDPKFVPLGAPASNLTGPTSRRPSPPIRPVTRASAARCSRSCATSTAPIASRSRSSRTS